MTSHIRLSTLKIWSTSKKPEYYLLSTKEKFLYFLFLVDFFPENKTTKRPEKMTTARLMTREIIISTGTVIAIVLLIVILFTIRNDFTSANVNGYCHCRENVQVDNVYSEIS